MRRRELLGAAGTSVFALAGCLGAGDGETGTTETATRTPRPPSETSGDTGTDDKTVSSTATTASTTSRPQRRRIGEPATFDDGSTLTVSNPSVQQSIIIDAGAFLTVSNEAGTQYLVVAVSGTEDPDPSDFAIRRDGQVADPPYQRQYVEPILRTCSSTCVGLSFEIKSTGDAAVVYKTDGRIRATWELGSETVATFGTRSKCELRDAELVDRDGDVAVRFTAENVGDRAVGFRALVAPAWLPDVSDPVGFPVPEGETVTETVVPDELDVYSPEEASFTHEIDETTRYFEVGKEPESKDGPQTDTA